MESDGKSEEFFCRRTEEKPRHTRPKMYASELHIDRVIHAAAQNGIRNSWSVK